MSDTIFNLLFASLIFWSSFLLCDLSLKRTTSGLYVYLIILGIFAIDCAMYYFTSFQMLPYAWYLFALFPIFILPLLYKNQLPTIVFTYISSLLFSFMIQVGVKIATHVIYLNYPSLYVQFDSALVLMIAMCLYLIIIPAFLRFAFEKIAKRTSSRAMLLTWLFPILCFGLLLYNDYTDSMYTTTIIRYMSCILVGILLVYILFYMMLTTEQPALRTAGAPHVQLERPAPQKSTAADNLVLFEKQYFESLINSYNDTLDRSYVIEKGLHTIQRLISENNLNEAQRCLTQLQYELKDIQLLEVTGNSIVDTLLSYYRYLYLKDDLRLNFNMRLPQNCGIRDLDLCILFGSLLQNAYDLLYECQIDHGEVLLECRLEDSRLQVTCSNTYAGDQASLRRAAGNFNLHSVRELCQTYHGDLRIECPRDIFYAYADLVI